MLGHCRVRAASLPRARTKGRSGGFTELSTDPDPSVRSQAMLALARLKLAPAGFAIARSAHGHCSGARARWSASSGRDGLRRRRSSSRDFRAGRGGGRASGDRRDPSGAARAEPRGRSTRAAVRRTCTRGPARRSRVVSSPRTSAFRGACPNRPGSRARAASRPQRASRNQTSKQPRADLPEKSAPASLRHWRGSARIRIRICGSCRSRS
jgi:hypothetical protein